MDYRLHKEPLLPLAVLVLTLTVAQSADSSCAAFHFPSVVNDTVISQENTTLTLPFEVTSTLNTFYCNESLKNFTIDVVKWDNKTLSTVCSIQHDSNGDCVSGSIKDTPCECGQEPRTYRLVKTLGRADSKAWGWKTSNDLAKSKKIVFNVTYDPGVRKLIVLGTNETKPIDVKGVAKVVCFWEKGNPPTSARLLGRHGHIMDRQKRVDRQEDTGQTRYNITDISCDDTGTIRCEASRASANASAALLVRCPPVIILHRNDLTATPGGNVHLHLKIRSYTRDIISCHLQKQFRSGNSRRPQECDSSGLSGSPPDLSLTLKLDNVHSDEGGAWALTMANDAGTGKTEFRLNLGNYNASVKELRLLNGTVPVDEGASVDVVCFWENGQPPTNARLLDRHGEILKSKESSGQMHYNFDTIRCEDAGIIRCEAPGASQNQSLPLLVRCLPEIKLQDVGTVAPGENVLLKLNIRSHTRNITQCQLQPEFGSLGPQECNLITNLTGVPPDLALTIQVSDIQEEDDGVWTLEITNDVGIGHLKFQLNVEAPVNLAVAVGATVGVIGFLAGCAAVFIMFFVKRRKVVIYKPKDTTRPTDQGFGRQSRQASSRTQRSSHMYMVPDDEEPSLSLRDSLSRDSRDHGQDSENIHRARAAALRTNQQQRLAGVDTQEMISFTRGREEPKISQQDNQRRIKLPDLTFGPGAVSTEVLKPGAKWCLNVQVMLEPMPADGSLGLASRSRQSAAPYERLLPVTGESARTMSSDAADQSHDDSSESEKHCADASPDLASRNRQSASPYECMQPITEESARAMSSDADQSHEDSSSSENHSGQDKRLEKVPGYDDARSVASDFALELFP